VTAETRSFDPDGDALARVQEFLGQHLPGALGPVITTKTCLYTLTPDRDLVIDSLPEHPGILLALGAAHGFKFASLIGRVLADLAVDGATGIDVEPYRIDRPLLSMDDPPTNWLV
jgi:sarcosine oxidase